MVLAIAGTLTAISVGAATVIVSYTQLSADQSMRRREAMRERYKQNRVELKKAIRAFRGTSGYLERRPQRRGDGGARADRIPVDQWTE